MIEELSGHKQFLVLGSITNIDCSFDYIVISMIFSRSIKVFRYYSVGDNLLE